MVSARQKRFQAVVDVAKLKAASPTPAAGEPMVHPGKATYDNVCSGCHAYNSVRAAPPITEIQKLYLNNPQGIVIWTKAPGKKRPQFGPMPAFAMLGDEALKNVAEYMLQMTPALTRTYGKVFRLHHRNESGLLAANLDCRLDPAQSRLTGHEVRQDATINRRHSGLKQRWWSLRQLALQRPPIDAQHPGSMGNIFLLIG
jgi:mono/diheme cytochrome c family protein